MFGIGSTELLIILVVALLILGPKKLPEIARSLGKGMAEFRRMSNDVKRTIDMEVDRAEEEERTKKTKKEMYPDKDKTSDTSSTSSTAGKQNEKEKKGNQSGEEKNESEKDQK
ncbi:MAG: Sec-independent protein translocase protein TatB [Desulfovibrionales bacterium]